MNRNSLYYLEHLDAFEIMESHIMDRVVQEYWIGSLDATGEFLEASSCYGILKNVKSSNKVDHEEKTRFYKPRSITSIRPHRFSFAIIRKSMSTRFFFEMFSYLGLACAFQYYVTSLSQEMNTINMEINEELLRLEEEQTVLD